MAKSSKNSSLSNLISAARNEAESVKEIKSIANQGIAPVIDVETPLEAHTPTNNPVLEEQPVKQQPLPKEPLKQQEKAFEDFLVKTDIRDTEIIRIPRELHKNLKTLSAASGSSMTQIMANILSDFFDGYQKEILAYKKKML